MIAGAAMAGLFTGTAARLNASTNTSTINAGIAIHQMDDSTGADKHGCKGKNDCKGKGGCKTSDNGCKGKNSCKGKGGCSTMGS